MKWVVLSLSLSMWVGCLPEMQSLTDPCASDCTATATVGSACAAAEDCGVGDACLLDFPGGYCQGFCAAGAASGTLCGNLDSGVCVKSGDGTPACVGACDPSDPRSCGRDTTACYSLEGSAGVGICFRSCASGADCDPGMSCDGQGLCRQPVASCDGLTDAGCRAGFHCFLSAQGNPFCGLAGDAGPGQACTVVAGCVEEHWCVSGVCRALCDTEDFSACGGVAASCSPLVRGTRLGFCIQ